MSAFEKLAAFTSKLCDKCAIPACETSLHKVSRCCDAMFCEFTWREMPADARQKYSPDWSAKIPLLKSGRCQVAPEDRPFCAGYLCPGWLKDRKVRREYQRLCEKAGIPANRKLEDR